jgi:hypothetical protein
LLVVDGPGDTVWGWLGASDAIGCDAVLELVAWQRVQGRRFAFGEPAAGMAGFRLSHEQAVDARAVALATGQPVVRYDDVALVALASRDRRLAAAFVARELGELAGSGSRLREPRETLRVYLENGHSVKTTQVLRGLNRSTVSRHLSRAQGALHHRIATRGPELLVALRLADYIEA